MAPQIRSANWQVCRAVCGCSSQYGSECLGIIRENVSSKNVRIAALAPFPSLQRFPVFNLGSARSQDSLQFVSGRQRALDSLQTPWARLLALDCLQAR